MPYYMKLGNLPKKRHVQFRRPDGKLYSEELFGTEGFAGPTSTMYHIHPPTQVTGWKTMYGTKPEYVEREVMRMRHLRTKPHPPKGDPITGRVVLFGNADVEMAVCVPQEQMTYHYKNGQGDECLFIHYGSGTLHTLMGTLKFGPRDYIVIPKGVTYIMLFDEPADGGRGGLPAGAPDGTDPKSMPLGKFLCFETANASHILPPPGYISKKTSQFLEHAPYCERDLVVPGDPIYFDEAGEFEVRIKARDCIHSYIYPYHPLDVVGWDGCYYPYIFNIDDFAPITGKLHMPPPIHQTFEGHNFVICSFCPRMLDWHEDAIPVPYNHSNLDSDEILYYVDGDYKARRGIESGSITVHPQGIPHGPHPGAVTKSLGATFTNELAVMCDTFRPMFPTKAALDMDDPKYPESWLDAEAPQGTPAPGDSAPTNGHPAAPSKAPAAEQGPKVPTW